jgi:hypothetical protein
MPKAARTGASTGSGGSWTGSGDICRASCAQATVARRVVVADLSRASVTMSVTVYVPAAAYVWEGVDDVLVGVPSPKSHT